MEAREESVKAEQDHGHGEDRNGERRQRACQEARRDDGAKPRSRQGEREHRERDEYQELESQGLPEEPAYVAHVRQLAPVEGGRAVGERGPLEERDALRAGTDRPEAGESQRLALRVREAVEIRRDPAELEAHERVRRKDAERVDHEHGWDAQRDQDDERERDCPQPGTRSGSRYSPNSRPISRHVVIASTAHAATRNTSTTQKRAPARLVRFRCSTRARRRAW